MIATETIIAFLIMVTLIGLLYFYIQASSKKDKPPVNPVNGGGSGYGYSSGSGYTTTSGSGIARPLGIVEAPDPELIEEAEPGVIKEFKEEELEKPEENVSLLGELKKLS